MKKLAPFLLIILISLPVVVLAADEGLKNPLQGVEKVDELIVRVIKGFLAVLSLFSLVMVIYGGFLYTTSGGNPEQLKKAKDTIVWALLGIAIAFLSLAIVNFVVKAFQG